MSMVHELRDGLKRAGKNALGGVPHRRFRNEKGILASNPVLIARAVHGEIRGQADERTGNCVY